MPIDIQAGVNKTYTIEKTAGYSPNGSGVFLAYHGLETSDYLDSATIPSTNIIYESRVRVDSAGLMYWGIGDNTDRNTGDHFLIGSYSANDKVYIYSINEGSTTYDSEALYINVVCSAVSVPICAPDMYGEEFGKKTSLAQELKPTIRVFSPPSVS